MSNFTTTFNSSALNADARGFSALADLHNSISDCKYSEIKIDCKNLRWFDAHLAAPFMTIINHSRNNKNAITLINLRDDIRIILSKNNFLASKLIDSYHTTIPVKRFDLNQEIEFADYSRRNLDRKEMPRMSRELRGKLFEGIDELFANCALHSKSTTGVVAAGQFFPRNERLAFAISDGGRGIDGCLRAHNISYLSPEDAIDWAMQSNNTTRQGDIPGGLGLKIIRDFIAMNNGKLLVSSGAGFWLQAGKNVTKERLRRPYPGTVVIMEIVTSDRSVYDLYRPADPRNIW